MKTLVLAAMTIAMAYGVSVFNMVLDEWKLFKTTTKRQFRSSAEEYDRLQTFMQSKDLAAKHNERYVKGLEDYHLQLNQFADWSPYEENQNLSSSFMDEYVGIMLRKDVENIIFNNDTEVPDSWDWNERGAVTEVLNQHNCGSCYAFTSAGAMESQVFIKHGRLTQLSVQQILDCTKSLGNSGCFGGTFENTFKYLKENGLAESSAYPYKESSGECRVEGKTLTESLKTYYSLFDGDEQKLKKAVATYGPVAVAVNAQPRTFQLYGGGVYTDSSCTSTLVHAVLLTGYGTDSKTGKDYWIIKNSWGSSWGENGFMRLGRNMNNTCGIGTLAYVPKL